ncbi:lantibiotic dehydratase C-terminal domain-containing protein [Nocardioides insulae]|uniref:lantibiotic dehydratase C-terminal domain-containing protein n=1 Tax=Nocardioides insulae TaxID=394734 RepID=UPI0004039104|nr:lantibiotic dehydratase C-terminal domain-containing protein [Nocardioides insulae]
MTTRHTSPGDWLGIHIYYAASPQPLLAQCLGPLVDDLKADGLLAGHFFINYWLEGPHVRLRLRPATAAAGAEVRARAEAAITGFLERRPALYNVETGFLSDLYNTLFDMELEDVDRDRYVGSDGRMNVRPNNSFAYQPYEPEYGKYGGPAGVDLAEWHFQHSSDQVLHAVRTLNVHVRTVALGTAAQLMMVMAASFLPDGEQLAAYLERYHGFWRRTFAGTDLVDYGTSYEDTPGLRARVDMVRAAITTGDLDRLPDYLAGWACHCLDLRERATALAQEGRLVFRSGDRTRDEVVTDPADARVRLLSPYLHMTNNRLHITIRDEAYLSALLARALRDSLSATAVSP